ncbi:response regulator [bacterium]|nr:response regulator [bacterium]
MMLKQMLERAGYEVMLAPEGKVGVRIYREEPPDVVITDIFMPGQEGIETIRDLCRDFPGVKIIAVSGGARGGSLNFLPAAEMFGAVRTLNKPFEQREILEALKEVFEEAGA